MGGRIRLETGSCCEILGPRRLGVVCPGVFDIRTLHLNLFGGSSNEAFSIFIGTSCFALPTPWNSAVQANTIGQSDYLAAGPLPRPREGTQEQPLLPTDSRRLHRRTCCDMCGSHILGCLEWGHELPLQIRAWSMQHSPSCSCGQAADSAPSYSPSIP